jgi:hypothetical protein
MSRVIADGLSEAGAAKFWSGQAEDIVAGSLAITSLQPGTLTAEKDYVSVDSEGALVKRSLSNDVSYQLSSGSESIKASRIDYASTATADTLDLSQQQVFRVDASTAITLAFTNEPAADRAMTVVVHISGNSPVTWPASIVWDEDEAPTLGDNTTKVVLFWDGIEWSGFVRVTK